MNEDFRVDNQQLGNDEMEYRERPPSQFRHKTGTSGRKRGLIIAAVTLAILALGGAAYWILGRHQAPVRHPATTSKAREGVAASTPTVQTTGADSTYKSTTLNIGVTFPKTWRLRETNDKQEIILTSPSTTYTKKGGSTVHGVFTIKLRNGTIPDGIKTTVGNAVAVADSQVIAYTKPTDAQRQYTNLSYAGADTDNFNFAIISGTVGYKAGQAFGGSVDLNGQAYLFAAGYGGDDGDALAFDPVPKASFDTAIFQQAVGIFESLQLF